MSSLVRLLLALAALVAVVTANNCVTEDIGEVTSYTVPLSQATVPPGGGVVDIPLSVCGSYGYDREAAGERVTACNKDSAGDAPTLSHDDLTPVTVTCPDGCPQGATVDTTLYCKQNQ